MPGGFLWMYHSHLSSLNDPGHLRYCERLGTVLDSTREIYIPHCFRWISLWKHIDSSIWLGIVHCSVYWRLDFLIWTSFLGQSECLPPANKKNQSGDRGIQKASQVQNRGEKQPHHELLGGDREFWRFLLFLEFCLFWHSIWLSIAIIWHILQETNTVFSSHPSSTIIYCQRTIIYFTIYYYYYYYYYYCLLYLHLFFKKSICFQLFLSKPKNHIVMPFVIPRHEPCHLWKSIQIKTLYTRHKMNVYSIWPTVSFIKWP